MADNKRLLAAKQPISTPIPPSLQAKMAAFANRAQPGSSSSAHPVLLNAASFPPPAPRPKPATGMAARRARPNFSLRDIDSSAFDGPIAAGLGAGRPSLLHESSPPRHHQSHDFASPFSNFSKIVYLSLFFLFSVPFLLSSFIVTHPVP